MISFSEFKTRKFKKSELIVFFLLLIIRLIYFFSYGDPKTTPDFTTYFEYNFSSLLHLDFSHAGRTPIYPLVLRALTFGNINNLYIVVAFQSLVSFLSLFYFYTLAQLLVKNKSFALIITLLYGASSMVFLYDNTILPESLALSGSIIFFYYITRYIKDARLKDYIKCNLLLVLLIFLRPSFLLFNIILSVFLLIRLLLKKKPLKELLVCLCTWLLILLYSLGFYSAFGMLTISDPMPRQLMLVCIDREYYKSYDDKAFVEMVDETLSNESYENKKEANWGAFWNVSNTYSQKETLSIAKKCIRANLADYIIDEAKVVSSTIRHSYLDNSYVNYKKDAMTIVDIINSIFNNIYPIHTLLIGFISFVFAIIDLIKNKTLDYLMIGLSVFILGVFFSTIVATNDEFIRTMIHIVPITYFAILYFIGIYVYKNYDFSEKIDTKKSCG